MFNKKDLSIYEEMIFNKPYMAIDINSLNNPIEYEINMLQNNPSLPFLDIELRQVDEKKRLIYDIGSKVNLNDYLNDVKSNIDILIEIVEGIYSTINLSKDYMLDSRKIVLDLDKIFVDKTTKLTYMIFLPLEIQADYSIEEKFEKLCKNIFIKSKKYKKTFTSDEKEIFETLVSGKFKFSSLKDIFSEYSTKKINKRVEKVKSTKDEENIIKEDSKDFNENKSKSENEYDKKEVYEDTGSQYVKSVIEEDYSEFEDVDCPEEDEEELNYKELKEIDKYNKSKNDKTNKLLIIQLIVVILIGSLVLLLSLDDKQFFMMMASAMGFIVLLFILLIVVNIKNKG